MDEVADADEIALQSSHPVNPDLATDPDEQDERKYAIDQERKMKEEGLTQEKARLAVDRDNLTAAIRTGLIREDASDLVKSLTDAQVTALCPNGNPPRFAPVKRVRGGTRQQPKYEPEKWRKRLSRRRNPHHTRHHRPTPRQSRQCRERQSHHPNHPQTHHANPRAYPRAH